MSALNSMKTRRENERKKKESLNSVLGKINRTNWSCVDE